MPRRISSPSRRRCWRIALSPTNVPFLLSRIPEHHPRQVGEDLGVSAREVFVGELHVHVLPPTEDQPTRGIGDRDLLPFTRPVEHVEPWRVVAITLGERLLHDAAREGGGALHRGRCDHRFLLEAQMKAADVDDVLGTERFRASGGQAFPADLRSVGGVLVDDHPTRPFGAKRGVGSTHRGMRNVHVGAAMSSDDDARLIEFVDVLGRPFGRPRRSHDEAEAHARVETDRAIATGQERRAPRGLPKTGPDLPVL